MTHDRPRPSKPWVTFDWVAPAVVALAICFQVQTDLTIGENTIRMSAADLLSPLLATLIFFDVRHNGLNLPSWRVPRLWLWLGALTAVMTAALIVGRINTGAWIPWAVYNKYAGWFALVWYFVLGGWFACRDDTKAIEWFVRTFLIFCCAVSLYNLLSYLSWFALRIDFPQGTESTRLIGFVKNPNTFGLLVAMALVVQISFMAFARIFSQRIHFLVTIILLVALFFSFSRSAWVGLVLALPILLYFKCMNVQRFLAAFIVAAAVCLSVLYVLPLAIESGSKVFGYENKDTEGSRSTSHFLLKQRFMDADDEGVKTRIESNRRAFAAWSERPLVGVGLGGFLWPQIQKNVKHPVIIHSTYLWWLTEFGLIGIIVFVGFFVACTYILVRKVAGRLQERQSLLPAAALGIVAVFAGASIGMEAMYQRHFWFLLGWALALPVVGGSSGRRVESAA